MRFNAPRSAYPLPILRPDGDDSNYLDSDLVFDISIDTSTSPNGIEVEMEVRHDDIKKLIQENRATVSLAVDCPDTYFYEIFDLADKPRQRVNLNERLVLGPVYFTLIVKASKSIDSFEPNKLEPDFSDMNFKVRTGDVLAISSELIHEYRLPPIRLGEDVFELVEEPGLEELSFEVDISKQKIRIGVGEELNKLVQLNMATGAGKINNISAIYLPALIDVLYQVKDGEDCSGQAWYEAVGMAMKGIGLDIESKDLDPLRAAQHLLKHPYQKLLTAGATS